MKRRMLLACALVLCTALSVPAFQVRAEEEPEMILNEEPSSKETGTSNLITSIRNSHIYQMLANGGTEFTYYTGCDPTSILDYMHEYADTIISEVTATVTLNDMENTETFPVTWTIPDTIDTSVPGIYTITGTIVVPEGYHFAEGIMTQIQIPFTILSSENSYPVTEIHLNKFFYNTMIPVDDEAALNEYLDEFSSLASSDNIFGVTEAGAEVLFDVTSDTSTVDIHTPGEYEITVHLSISDENTLHLSLPEELSTIRQYIKVSRPEDFELWISGYDNDTFYFKFLRTLDSSYHLYITESDHELSYEELSAAVWIEEPYHSLDTTRNDLSVLRRNLTQETYYYYQIRSGETVSEIAMLQDNGQRFKYTGITGNRDGSSDTPGADDVIQPAPRPADPEPPSQPETSEQPETPAPSEDSAPMESFTEDSDTIYGTRLDLTRKNHGGSASFSKHDIQATLSSDTLDSLNVGTNDSLTVEIKQETPSSVTLSVSKNGEPITEIPDTQITVPVDGELYSFTVQESGTYELPETESNSQNEDRSTKLPPSDPSGGLFSGDGIPIYLGLSALSLGGIFLILRRRIFR